LAVDLLANVSRFALTVVPSWCALINGRVFLFSEFFLANSF
jgi:hypothetical protein